MWIIIIFALSGPCGRAPATYCAAPEIGVSDTAWGTQTECKTHLAVLLRILSRKDAPDHNTGARCQITKQVTA
jgi:hypothetical protein